jgi:uncharacterized protein (TIGR03435 family)
MGSRRLTAATLCGAVLVPAVLNGQLPLPEGPPVDPALRFDVASIKPYNEDGPTRVRIQPPGRLNITGASVRILLQTAFRVRADEVFGLPDRSETPRYSIVANAPDGAPITAIPTMLANLLADRFSLVIHREAREIERFDLVLARDDGKLGPELRPTSGECEAMVAKQAPASTAPVRSDPNAAPCGTLQAAPGLARASGVALGRLVQVLSQASDRTVNDLTGLAGLYDFTLKFNPEVNVDPVRDRDAAPLFDTPQLFTALQEQLGLRLVSRRGTAQVVVVDRIETPTAD